MEEHRELDLEYDQPLINDLFDTPSYRYIIIYSYLIRKEVFQNFEEDEQYEQYVELRERSEVMAAEIKDLDQKFVEKLLDYRLIKNIKDYTALRRKAEEFVVKFEEGIEVLEQKVEVLEGNLTDVEILLCITPQAYEQIIRPDIPELSASEIDKACVRLRSMPCPALASTHAILHKYGDFYELDDKLYEILDEQGNPGMALKMELFMRQMDRKYSQFKERFLDYLDQFYPELSKAKFQNKFAEAYKNGKEDFVGYLIEKSRTLPEIFDPPFPEDEPIPDAYTRWREMLNKLLQLYYDFLELDKRMDEIRSYYSGMQPKMHYFEFIYQISFNIDGLNEKIRDLVFQMRRNLKHSKRGLADFSKREIRILGVELQQAIINFAELEED